MGNCTDDRPAPDQVNASENLAILAMALAAFVLNLNTNVMGALLPFLGSSEGGLALDGEQKLWLLSAAAGASALGALMAGPFADRRGRRLSLVIGLLAFILASVAHLLADSFAALLVARIASGLPVGVAYAAASALLADLVPYHRRGRAMGMFTTGMFLAVPIGLPLAVVCANAGAWRTIFLIQAGVGVAALLLTLRVVPRDEPGPLERSTWTVLRRPGVAAALLATMLHVGSFFVTVQLAGDWLDSSGILPKADQGQLWIWLGLVSALGSLTLSRVGDAVGKRNFVLLTSVLLVACLLWIGRVDSLASLWPAGLALALVAAARTGPLQALVSGLAPGQEQATLMGARAAGQQAGIWLFALAMGPVYESMGFSVVVFAAAGCQALSYLAIRLGVREVG